MASLTPQQIDHLDTLDHETLLDIILNITCDNIPAYNTLVDRWLSAADEVLDRLAHEYNSLAKGHDYYRYYESCDLFYALLHDIAYPLAKHVERFPAGVEHLAAKWLLDYDRLMEITDSPRDDDDETYLSSLLSSWFQALTLQPTREPKETAQAAVILRCHMAEWAMEHGGRECYEAAAVDVSAAFGYCSASNLPELSNRMQVMYAKYHRKYTLWKIMRENVPGLSISKGIGPVWQQQG